MGTAADTKSVLDCDQSGDIAGQNKNAYDTPFAVISGTFDGLDTATNYMVRCATEHEISEALSFTTRQTIQIIGYSETSLEASTIFTVGGSARCCIMEEGEAETEVAGVIACESAPPGVQVPVATEATGGAVFKAMFNGLTPNTKYEVTCAQSTTNKISPKGTKTTTMSGLDVTSPVTDSVATVKVTFYQGDNTNARCCVRKAISPQFSNASEVMACANVDGAPASPAVTNYANPYDVTVVKFEGLTPGTSYVARCAQDGDDGAIVDESLWSAPIPFDTRSVVTVSKITENTFVATTKFAVNDTNMRCCLYTPGSEPNEASAVSCPNLSAAVVGNDTFASTVFEVLFSELTSNTEYTVVCASAAASVTPAGAISLVSEPVRTTESTVLSNTISEATFSVSARFSAASTGVMCCAREVIDANTPSFPAPHSKNAANSVLACGSNDGDVESTQSAAVVYSTAYSLAQFDFAYPQLKPETSYEVICAAKDVYGTSAALKVKTQAAPTGSGTVSFHLRLWGVSATQDLSLPYSVAIKDYFASADGFFAQGIRPWQVQLSMYASAGSQSAAVITVKLPALLENVRAATQTKIDKLRDDLSKSNLGSESVFKGLVPILRQLAGGKMSELSMISFYDEPSLSTPAPLAQTETSVNVGMTVSIPGMHEATTVDQVRAAIAAWFDVNIEDVIDVDLSFVGANAVGRLLASSTTPAFGSVRFTLRTMNQRDADTKKNKWQKLHMNATTPTQNKLLDSFFQDLRDQGVRASNTTAFIPIGRGVLGQSTVQDEELGSFTAATPIVVKPNITAIIIASSNCSTVNDDYELADLAQELANEARMVASKRAASCGVSQSPSSLDEANADATEKVEGLSTGGLVGLMFGMAAILGVAGIACIYFIQRRHEMDHKGPRKESELVLQYKQNPNRV